MLLIVRFSLQHISRPLTPADWVRFLKYSALVKFIVGAGSYADPEVVFLGPEIWQEIQSSKPTPVLFPNLRALDWPRIQLASTCLPSFLSCVGGNLNKLVIGKYIFSVAAETALVDTTLQLIVKQFPALREIVIGSSDNAVLGYSPASVSSLSALACALPSLTCFESSEIPLTENAIITLASLTTLRYLSIRLPEGATWARLPSALRGDRPFLNIITLDLVTTTQAYIAFSAAVKPPNIRSLCVCLSDVPPLNLISTLFTSIRHQAPLQTLCGIRICHTEVVGASMETWETSIIRSSDLRPLLDFRHVQAFHISLRCRYALDEAIYADMAKAWPDAEVLLIAEGHSCRHDRLPNIRVLVPFAIHCRYLRDLGIRFDATFGPAPQQGPDGARTNARRCAWEKLLGPLTNISSRCRLETLAVGTSDVPEPQNVAAFLARLFPRLSTIETNEPLINADETRVALWRYVEELLSAFLKIREDEGRRIGEEISIDVSAFQEAIMQPVVDIAVRSAQASLADMVNAALSDGRDAAVRAGTCVISFLKRLLVLNMQLSVRRSLPIRAPCQTPASSCACVLNQ